MTAAFTVVSIFGTAQSAPFHERKDSSAPQPARETILGCATPPTDCADTSARLASAGTLGEVTVIAESEATDEPGPPTARSSTPVESPTYSGSLALRDDLSSCACSGSSCDHVVHVPPVSVRTSSATVPVIDVHVCLLYTSDAADEEDSVDL